MKNIALIFALTVLAACGSSTTTERPLPPPPNLNAPEPEPFPKLCFDTDFDGNPIISDDPECISDADLLSENGPIFER